MLTGDFDGTGSSNRAGSAVTGTAALAGAPPAATSGVAIEGWPRGVSTAEDSLSSSSRCWAPGEGIDGGWAGGSGVLERNGGGEGGG